MSRRGFITDRSGSITAGGTAQSLCSASTNRRYIFIENISSGDLWVDIGVTAVADQPSIKIVAGAAFVMEDQFVATGPFSIIGATTGQKFVAKEGFA